MQRYGVVQILNAMLDVSSRQLTSILGLLILVFYVSGLDLVYSTTSQEKDDDDRIQATTSCMGFGSMSESEADARLLSDGNNVTQQCEQLISSGDGDGSTSKNYATNDVIVDNERTETESSQVSQQSKQKITD
jgi:hypothetical protein